MGFKCTLTVLTLCSLVITTTFAASASLIPDHPSLLTSSVHNEEDSIILSKLKEASGSEGEGQFLSNNNDDIKVADKEQRLFFLSSLLAPFLPKPVVAAPAPVGPPQIIVISQNPNNPTSSTPRPATTTTTPVPGTNPPIIIIPPPAPPQFIPTIVKPPLFSPVAKPPILQALDILNVNPAGMKLPERIGDTDIYVPNFNLLQGDRLPIPLHLIQNQSLPDPIPPGQTQAVTALSNDDIR